MWKKKVILLTWNWTAFFTFVLEFRICKKMFLWKDVDTLFKFCIRKDCNTLWDSHKVELNSSITIYLLAATDEFKGASRVSPILTLGHKRPSLQKRPKMLNPGWSKLFPHVGADTLLAPEMMVCRKENQWSVLGNKTGGEREGARKRRGITTKRAGWWPLAQNTEKRVLFSLVSVARFWRPESRTWETFLKC